MSKHFVQNAGLRAAMLAGFRAYARSQVWRSGPRVFINSIPKAGTHLLTAELARFDNIVNSWLHIQVDNVRVPGERTPEGYPIIALDKVSNYLSQVRKGQFFSAHLYWSRDLENLIAAGGSRMIFVTRDPRDILMSRMHYIEGLRRHRLHDFLMQQFTDTTDRLRALISGHSSEPFCSSFSNTLRGFLPWAQSAEVLTVRFEDLVGERGGGTAALKRGALQAIADHCGLDAGHLEELASSSSGATATLRKGKIGGWRTEMPEEIVGELEAECGDIMRAIGYPPD